MGYSIGNPTDNSGNVDYSAALNGVNDAYKDLKNPFEGLSSALGSLKNTIQDNADARYVAALNKYANDPTGLAKALQNGEIDTSNVRADTLGKTQDIMSNIQQSYGLNYVQGRQENLDKFMDDPNNTQSYYTAVRAAQNGDKSAVDKYLASFNGPGEFYSYLSKLNPVEQQNKLAELDISRRAVAAQAASANLGFQKFAIKQKAANAYTRFHTIAQNHNFGDPNNPDYNRQFLVQYMNGTLKDKNNEYYKGTIDDVADIMADPEFAKLFANDTGWNVAKYSGGGTDPAPENSGNNDNNGDENKRAAEAFAGTKQ